MWSPPHRHHGGDRLRREGHPVPAGAGLIMIPVRSSNRTKSNRQPDARGPMASLSSGRGFRQLGRRMWWVSISIVVPSWRGPSRWASCHRHDRIYRALH
jgi:hypothetical protein